MNHFKIFFIALASMLIISCDQENNIVKVTDIEMTPTPDPMTLTVGGEPGKIAVKFLPADATDQSVIFSAVPEGIVTIAADGTVTPIGPGTATITATAEGNVTETCPVTVKEQYSYTGTFSVAPGTPSAYTLDNVKVLFTLDGDGVTGQIKMQRVKFAGRMPEMDITVPGVTLTAETGGYSLSCGEDGIIPIMAGGPFPDRTITGIVGSATTQNLSLSFVCMDLPVSFTGVAAIE